MLLRFVLRNTRKEKKNTVKKTSDGAAIFDTFVLHKHICLADNYLFKSYSGDQNPSVVLWIKFVVQRSNDMALSRLKPATAADRKFSTSRPAAPFVG